MILFFSEIIHHFDGSVTGGPLICSAADLRSVLRRACDLLRQASGLPGRTAVRFRRFRSVQSLCGDISHPLQRCDDFAAAHVRPQDLRDHDAAVLLLVVFEYGRDRPSYSESRSVQSVYELRL